jgi:hypothetical protein
MCILFPNSQLKPQLLAFHRANRFQKIQKLHQLGDSGDKKSSELLASMLDLCKRARGLLFLQLLPAELRELYIIIL